VGVVSRHIAWLYTAAANALEIGHYATAARVLRQIGDDLATSGNRAERVLSTDAERLAAALSYPLAGCDPRVIRGLRMAANDCAEAARGYGS
jgi:hypothetical protein